MLMLSMVTFYSLRVIVYRIIYLNGILGLSSSEGPDFKRVKPNLRICYNRDVAKCGIVPSPILQLGFSAMLLTF